MSSPGRRAEIDQIHKEAREAAREGRSRNCCPYSLIDQMHWLRAYDEEKERMEYEAESTERAGKVESLMQTQTLDELKCWVRDNLL